MSELNLDELERLTSARNSSPGDRLLFAVAMMDSAPALIEAARERDELKAERDELRFKLGIYADAAEFSGMSWSGFNILGDKKSIREVQRLENRSSQLEVYQQGFENRTSALSATNSGLRAQLAEAREALKPFAEVAMRYSPEECHGRIFDDDDCPDEGDILIGSLRRASAVLAELQQDKANG